MKVNALLTGRGNNTLRDKNVLDILGHPVLYYPAHAARKSSLIANWYCSSDDEKILSAAEDEGYKRILRPQSLALPTAQHVDCILHALDVMKACGDLPDICVVLLANNVTVKSEWITECVQQMLDDNTLTAVVPTYIDNDHHPLRAKSMTPEGYLKMYQDGVREGVSTNRQDLPPCIFLAHNFWVLNVRYLLSGQKGQPPWSFMGDKIKPFLIEKSIDIHEETDLYTAKVWIQQHYVD